jgi:hypothetical protein
MPAAKLDFLIAYKNSSQVFGCRDREVALTTPPPAGNEPSDKRVWFISHEPDSDNIVLRRISQETVEKYTEERKTKKKAKEAEDAE